MILVDYVVEQGELAAQGAKVFIDEGGTPTKDWKLLRAGRNVCFVVPHMVSGDMDVWVYSGVRRPMERVELKFEGVNWSMKLPVVRPSEMLRVKLKASDVMDSKVDEFILEVSNDESRGHF